MMNRKSFLLLMLLLLASANVAFMSPFSSVKAQPEGSSTVISSLPFDWTVFWQKFREHSVWDLEWLDGISWVSVKEDLSVRRSFPNETCCKVTLIFDASYEGSYRLTFAIDERVREYVQRLDKFQYELSYEGYNVVFDWADLLGIPNLIITHGLKEVAGEQYFWFRIRRDSVPLGAHVEIDPAVVATSTVSSSVSFSFQRKGFYAAGRYWAFYSDGTNAVYESTTDPNDWSGTATSIDSCSSGSDFSIWFDGTYVHYARYYNYDLFYRRGTPNSDGTITWSAASQTVYDGTSANYYSFPCITVDSGGYAWIGVQYYNGASYFPYVTKNANNDGTWSTEFNYALSATSSASWYVQPVALTSSKVYVIYCRSAALPRGKLYTGSWGSEESDLADYNIVSSQCFCAVNEGDNVHFTYNRASTYQIRYNKRTYGTGWGVSDVLVQDSVEYTSVPALSINTANNDLYCFWTKIGTDHIYYKKCVSGTWDTNPTDWINESTDQILYGDLLNSWYQAYGGYLGLLYVTKTSSPYNIKFAYLTITAGGYALNLRAMDWDLTDAISGAIVYKDSDYKTSNGNGWANWTSVSGTVQVKVKYFGFWVNGTFSVTVDSDKTINVKCKLYDATVTAKPNNEIGVISGANITTYNNTGTWQGKIKSGITVDITGQVTLTNVPNATLRFIMYSKSDYSIIIANTTQLISSDGYSFSIVANQNYATATVSFGYEAIIWMSGLTVLQLLAVTSLIVHKKIKKRNGGEKARMQRKYV